MPNQNEGNVIQPTHHKLMYDFKAFGPYLREGLCEVDSYFFDCLSVCINDNISPEKREFWGWWMILAREGKNLTATYKFGRYDDKGNWQLEEVPGAEILEVISSKEVFEEKLLTVAQDKHGLTLSISKDSVQFN